MGSGPERRQGLVADANAAGTMMQDFQFVGAQIFRMWHKFLSVYSLVALDTVPEMRARWQERRVKRWCESIFRETLPSTHMACPSDKPAYVNGFGCSRLVTVRLRCSRCREHSHAFIVETLRKSNYYQTMKPLAIQEMGLDYSAAMHPILFEQRFGPSASTEMGDAVAVASPAELPLESSAAGIGVEVADVEISFDPVIPAKNEEVKGLPEAQTVKTPLEEPATVVDVSTTNPARPNTPVADALEAESIVVEEATSPQLPPALQTAELAGQVPPEDRELSPSGRSALTARPQTILLEAQDSDNVLIETPKAGTPKVRTSITERMSHLAAEQFSARAADHSKRAVHDAELAHESAHIPTHRTEELSANATSSPIQMNGVSHHHAPHSSKYSLSLLDNASFAPFSPTDTRKERRAAKLRNIPYQTAENLRPLQEALSLFQKKEGKHVFVFAHGLSGMSNMVRYRSLCSTCSTLGRQSV